MGRRRRIAGRGTSHAPSSPRGSAPSVRSKLRYVNAWWNGSEITAIAEGDDGSRSLKRIRGDFSCYLRKSDVDSDLKRELRRSRACTGFREAGDFYRVTWKDRNVRKAVCRKGGWFDSKEVPTFEGDVNPVRRWLADNDVKIAKPRRAYLDIETDSRVPIMDARDGKARILCWTVVVPGGEFYTGMLEQDSDDDERRILRELFEVLVELDQVCAWFGSGFDFPAIRGRCRKLGLRLNWRRWLWLDHLELFRRMNTMAAESGEEKQSMALNAVARSLKLGSKDDLDASKTYAYWSAGGAERKRLLDYCVRDTDLLRLIEEKTGYIDLLQTLAEACGIFADDFAVNPSTQVDGFMLRLGRSRDVRFPTKFRNDNDEHEKYRGAFVMEPTDRGILRGIHVADFKSLYPSIILSWNMSPEKKTQGDLRLQAWLARPSYLKHQKRPEPSIREGTCRVPITEVYFETGEKGILPEAIETMLEMRRSWNEKKASCAPGTPEWKDADRRSTAYKIAANSFYGVMGAPTSRYFDKEVAESVSQGGVWLIRQTMRFAEENAMRVVYGDTDSIFVTGCTEAGFREFVKRCNAELYPKGLEALGCARNEIVLDYEKAFERIVMITKKRYFGRFAHYKGARATADSKPEVKGLEYKRGDSIRLCRSMQEEFVTRMLSDEAGWDSAETYVEMTERWLKHVLLDPFELGDIVISKGLSKKLSEYKRKRKKDKTWARQAPHIEIARARKEANKPIGVGGKVRYYIADASGKEKLYRHADEWDGKFDRYEVWENSIWPAIYRVLKAAFPAYPWEEYDRVRAPKRRQRKPLRKGQILAAEFEGRELYEQQALLEAGPKTAKPKEEKPEPPKPARRRRRKKAAQGSLF